jgi:hypothetical protein
MKKILALVMVLGVIGGVLAGCSGGDAANTTNAPVAPAAEKAAE